MLTVRIKKRQIDRTIDKYPSFSQWKKGERHRLAGTIGASKVLVLFPRYSSWYATFANTNEPKQRIITGHGHGLGLCSFLRWYRREKRHVLILLS
jgi:hypothetical protein